MTNLFVHSLAYPVTALGPGRRVALWVAGCSIGCRGCITPSLWKREAGTEVYVARALRKILKMEQEFDGITLTGGEPFEQAEALADLLEGVMQARPSWNVLTFTGYRLTALKRRGEGAQRLLACTDILVAGPYQARRPPIHPLAGSGNQTIHYLTERGHKLEQIIGSMPWDEANLALGGDGRHMLVGIIRSHARHDIHHNFS